MKGIRHIFSRLSDIKTRTLLIVVGLVILVIVGLVLTSTRESKPPEVAAEVKTAHIGEIASLAGTGEYNEEYAKLQLAENERLAQEAQKSGQAAIPRLINPKDENQANLSFGQEACAECVYDPQGYDQYGYDAKGYDKDGFDADGYNADGYDKDGFDRDGYDKDGYDKDGFDRNGCNRQGLDREGKSCYDAQGYNADGYDRFGYDKNGFDKNGFDKDGYDKDGFNKDGCNREGLDRQGKPCYGKDGYNVLGYDKNGFDKDGYDKDGFNKDGCNRQGVDRNGQPCNGITLPTPANAQNPEEAYRRLLDEQQKARDAQLAAQKTAEEEQRNLAEQQAMQQAFEALLRSQSMSAVANWKPEKQMYVKGVELTQVGFGTQGEIAGAAAGSTTEGNVLYKAGSIVFATLDTEVNSDNPGPVLATIVQGPLAGSKVLGDLRRQEDKVMLRFNLLSAPDQPTSLPLNAVAVDAATARTALATGVDNHYFLRYGSLFASAFLEGIGEAFLAGITQPVAQSSTGLVVVQSADVTTQDAVAVGLGTVGQAWGENLGDVFDKPPTVTVDSGTGIGVLFMKDFIINEGSPEEPTNATTPVGNQAQAAPLEPTTTTGMANSSAQVR